MIIIQFIVLHGSLMVSISSNSQVNHQQDAFYGEIVTRIRRYESLELMKHKYLDMAMGQ